MPHPEPGHANYIGMPHEYDGSHRGAFRGFFARVGKHGSNSLIGLKLGCSLSGETFLRKEKFPRLLFRPRHRVLSPFNGNMRTFQEMK